MYYRGWYVARDPARALQYFKKALDRGVGAAANAIGVFAAHGVTMPADFSVAAKWFAKGSNMSDCDSIYNLGTLYLHGTCCSLQVIKAFYQPSNTLSTMESVCCQLW